MKSSSMRIVLFAALETIFGHISGVTTFPACEN